MEKYFWIKIIESGRVVIARQNEYNPILYLPSMVGETPLYFTKDEIEILEEIPNKTIN